MRSPQDMQIILIDITNACNERCSNCTRFCGNHRKNFFMSFETFKRAVDSMQGFEGLVALIGGEPTLHPEFARFAEYLQNVYGKNPGSTRLAYPQREFIKELLHQEFDDHRLHEYPDGHKTFERWGPGLYSNMSSTYRKYQELCADTFYVQFLNDHKNPSFHQPALIARKDLGISDEEWIPMRDACWLQGAWSATITPKGAFFCEIAAALDMLFDGPGGWPIEHGWWKRKPEDFGEQLKWCEYCGFAINTFMRESADEIDDVSPSMYRKLEEIGSPRLKSGRTHIVEIVDGKIAQSSRADGKNFSATQKYVEHYEDRFCEDLSILYENEYREVCIEEGALFGISLNREISKANGWLLVYCNSSEINKDEIHVEIEKLMSESILNPGTLHIGEGYILLHKNAYSIKKIGFDRIAGIIGVDDLCREWQQEKIVKLWEIEKLPIWRRKSIKKDSRYVIWGMGVAGSFLADAVNCSGGKLVFVVDHDSAKWDTDFYGATAHAPEYLIDHNDEYDYLLIGHYSRFDEIYDEGLKMGIEKERLIMPYEI
ncbi:MAG: radical SAM protein [Lachnospiraceae bacterium]|nr:radical SAM protein [Lachnospiraceae bacterium]